MTNIMQIEFSSRFTEIVDKNKSFGIGKLLIAYTGLNRNNTFISKEAFEKAIPSMYNCPIVAKYTRSTDQIGEHDGEWVDKNGKKVYVNTTHPVGVVPESAEYEWVEIEDNGKMHEYIMVDALLWKRQEAYEKIKTDGITSQSMEINVKSGQFENGYYNIEEFEFTAFCLLGTAEPCFESASLFTFSSDKEKDQFVNEFKEMMDELKLSYSSKKEEAKEENAVMDFIDKLLEKYNLTMEDIPEDISELSETEVEAKFVEIKKVKDDDDYVLPVEDDEDKEEEEEETPEEGEDAKDPEEGEGREETAPELEPEPEGEEATEPEAGGGGEEEGSEDPIEEPVEDPVSDEPTDEGAEDTSSEGDDGNDETFRLVGNDIDSISKIIRDREIVIHEQGTEWEWKENKYHFLDLDPEAGLVYYDAWEDGLGYIVYAAPYVMNGDIPEIDFEAEKRQKRIYVDFEEGAQEYTLDNPANAYVEVINNLISENKELGKYKKICVDEEKERLFNSFEDKLNNNTDYEALKENADKYTLEALEKELFALYGKTQMEFSKNTKKQNSILLNNPNVEGNANEPYGGLFERNGFKKITNKEEK